MESGGDSVIELKVPSRPFGSLRDVAVGMRVMMLENSGGPKYGMTGKVVGFEESYVGVQFDEGFERGHDCGGKGEAPKCWWVWHEYLGEVK